MPGKNFVHFSGDGQGQTVYVEYTEDSTSEDPIVRISGNALSGSYDQVVHINNIDPNRASYAELCALMGHKAKTGEYKPEFGLIMPVPMGVDRGDFSKPLDFMRKIRAWVGDTPRFGFPKAQKEYENLLAIYDKILSELAQPKRPGNAEDLRDYAGNSQVITSALMAFMKTPVIE